MLLRILPVTCALVTLCCVTWLPGLHSTAEAYPQAQIHQRMSIDDLINVFQVNSHSSVPEYQVVHARSLSKRHATDSGGGNDTKEVFLSAFGRDFRLRLQRNDHLSKSADRLKVFVAEMHADGNLNLTEVTFPDNSSEIGDVYQDDASGAAVLLHHAPDGTILLDGTIGGNLAIKPAPPSLRSSEFRQHFRLTTEPDDEMFLDNELPPKSSVSNDKPEVDDDAEDESVHSNTDRPKFYSTDSAPKGMHIVYQRKPEESSTFSDYMFMEPDRVPVPVLHEPETNNNNATRRTRRKRREQRAVRETPNAVWPEILVIVDYDTYNMHGGNNMDIKRYFISFWNGVDLRYKLLGGPKVRISLAGIIISKGRDATPYLENNRVGGNAVDSAGALTELGKYLYRERRLPTYDVAVVVTKLDLCRREFTVGSCNKGTAGFAYVGGACVVNKRLEKVNSVAIIEDTGGFSGIIVAAHEVGHLLGAVHDGSPPPSYLGGPGAEHCRWEDGYIMSDLRHTERGFKWSICSIQQFKHFLNGDTAKCLYNIPHEDDELPRLLPGKLLSLDAQCRKDRGTSACFKDDRVCAQLFCFDSRSGYCVSYRPAAEGSPCGDGQYCINGRCITENENVIPDFSRVSEIAVPKPSDIVQSVSSMSGEGGGVGGDEDEIHGKEYPELARIVAAPKRTAVLNNEEDISIVSRSGKVEDDSATKTSVLDGADSVGGLDSNGGRQMVQFDNRADDDAVIRRKFQPRRHVDGDSSVPFNKRLRTRGNGGERKQENFMSLLTERDESEVPHMRRTSHLDEVDELSFSDDTTTITTTLTTPRSSSNDITKARQQLVNVDTEKLERQDTDEFSGCEDVMNKLAGGLSCKQFLRRFGDRYCNHHYIVTNCCSSRKTVCQA